MLGVHTMAADYWPIQVLQTRRAAIPEWLQCTGCVATEVNCIPLNKVLGTCAIAWYVDVLMEDK